MGNSLTDDLITYKKGTVLFVEGEPSNFLYLIKSGQVKVFKEEKTGLFPISISEDQEFVGEETLFSDEARPNTAIATEDTEVFVFKKSEIRKVVKSCPEWIDEIMETICERLKHAQEMMAEHSIISEEVESDFQASQGEVKTYRDAISKYRKGRGL